MDVQALIVALDEVAEVLDDEFGTGGRSTWGDQLREHAAAVRGHGQALVTLAQSWEAKAAPYRDAPRTTQRRLVSDAQTDCALELRFLAYPLIPPIERTLPCAPSSEPSTTPGCSPLSPPGAGTGARSSRSTGRPTGGPTA